MGAPRAVHTATVLEDGRVLIVGGCTMGSCEVGPASSTTEIFDPATERFRTGPALGTARVGHTATRLPDGRVLLAGGWVGSTPTETTEIFDPESGTVEPGPDLDAPRASHTATLLADGRVLIVGGRTGPDTNTRLATTEIFDPRTDRLDPGPEMATPRSTHASARLADGRVLVCGGSRTKGRVIASAEVFVPAARRFVAVGAMASPRHKHALVALPDGGALVVAGSDARDYDGKHASIERFDPTTGGFSSAGTLASPRFKLPDSVVLLPDGGILIAGGSDAPRVFDPGTRTSREVSGSLGKPWSYMTATTLPSGKVLLAGGYEEGRIVVSRRAWVYGRG